MKNKSFYLTLAAFLVMLFAMNVLIFSFTRIKSSMYDVLQGSHQPLSLNDFIKQEPELQHQSFEKHRSVEEISKFQKEQVELFCTNKTVAQRRNDMLNSNIIVSTQRETAFCSVPKSGCTNLLIMFFTADGLFSNKKKYYSWTNGLINAVNRGKLGSIKNTTQRNLVLEEYFKFTMYRSPLDRFVSGYRDKVCGKDTAYFWLRDAVYKFNHGKLPSQVQVTFSDFVNYFLTSPHSGSVKGDVHFMPFQNICNPCVAKYDYYGNFDSFERDSKVLMDHMGATEDYLSPSYYNSTTAAKKENYFDQLSDAQKRGVFEYFRNELDLYYRIFPDERGIHKNMLNITDDIN